MTFGEHIGGKTVEKGTMCKMARGEMVRYMAEIKEKIILVDFHAEGTSEKRAMGFLLDGRASAVWGTHTHVQTSDAEVLPLGTG